MDIRGLGDGRLNDTAEVGKILEYFQWSISLRPRGDGVEIFSGDQPVASFGAEAEATAFLAVMALVCHAMPYEVARAQFESDGSSLPADLLTEWWTLR